MVLYCIYPFLKRFSQHEPFISAPDHSTNTVSEFHAEAPQATVSKGLAQGPYLASRVGFEPMTLWTKGIVLLTLKLRELLHNATATIVCLFVL